MTTGERLGQRLRQLRLERGWSIRHTAQKVKISHWRYAELETGRSRSTGKPTRPSTDTVDHLADAFEVPRDHLRELAGYAKHQPSLSTEASELLDMFNDLDPDLQAMAIRIVRAMRRPADQGP